jgi:hypothetical protein
MTTITYARRVSPRRQDAGTVHAVIARRPKADVAIQESPGAYGPWIATSLRSSR